MNLSLLRQASSAANIGRSIIRRKHLRAEFRDEAARMFEHVELFVIRLRQAIPLAYGPYGAVESRILSVAASLSAVTPVRFCLQAYAAQIKSIITALKSNWCRVEEMALLFPKGDACQVLEELARVYRWAHKASLWQEAAFYPRDKSQVDLKDTVPYLLPKRYRRS